MSHAIPRLVVNHASRGMDVHSLGAACPELIPELRMRIAKEAGVEGAELDDLLAMSPPHLRRQVLIATRDGNEGRVRTLLAVASPRHLRYALLCRPGKPLSPLSSFNEHNLGSLLSPPESWTLMNRVAAMQLVSTWTSMPLSQGWTNDWLHKGILEGILERYSPIYLATTLGLAHVVEQLLEHLAEEQLMPPEFRGTLMSQDSKTPLMIAAERGDIKIVHTMLRTVPNKQLAAKNVRKGTAFKIAAGKGHEDVMRTMCTAFKIAAGKGHEEVVRILLEFDFVSRLLYT